MVNYNIFMEVQSPFMVNFNTREQGMSRGTMVLGNYEFKIFLNGFKWCSKIYSILIKHVKMK